MFLNDSLILPECFTLFVGKKNPGRKYFVKKVEYRRGVTVKHKPLENRVYKYKNPSKVFYCPLCRTERAVTISPRLTLKNYVQIFLTSIVLGAALFPLMNVRSFFVFFVVWAAFEDRKSVV